VKDKAEKKHQSHHNEPIVNDVARKKVIGKSPVNKDPAGDQETHYINCQQNPNPILDVEVMRLPTFV
jgi:hypothetical protein